MRPTALAGRRPNNTGSVNDSTQVMNACVQGEWFTTDTLMGNSGYPSDSELEVDATDGTFSFQPIPHDYVTHTIYNCQGSQSGQESWATAPADHWPLNFTLPQQVGPLTVTNFPFSAASRYAGYQDIGWTITLNLTPILPGYQPLTVAAEGNGAVASTDGVINCPGVCSHFLSSKHAGDAECDRRSGIDFRGMERRLHRDRTVHR